MHEGAELIPRPEKTPAALKAAVAIVAPSRLQELTDGQITTMAKAIEESSIAPLQSFCAPWATMVEIERVPAIAQEYRRANHLADHADTDAERMQAAMKVATLYRRAAAAVAG